MRKQGKRGNRRDRRDLRRAFPLPAGQGNEATGPTVSGDETDVLIEALHAQNRRQRRPEPRARARAFHEPPIQRQREQVQRDPQPVGPHRIPHADGQRIGGVKGQGEQRRRRSATPRAQPEDAERAQADEKTENAIAEIAGQSGQRPQPRHACKERREVVVPQMMPEVRQRRHGGKGNRPGFIAPERAGVEKEQGVQNENPQAQRDGGRKFQGRARRRTG